MKLTPAVLEMDFAKVQSRICRFIKEYIENTEAKGIILGLSGGIDSALTAALSSLAIGGENVLALILPEKETCTQQDLMDAKTIADMFHLQTQTVDMSEVLDVFYKSIPIFDHANRLCKGNIKARTRMIYLYYYANIQNRIVVGTSDKSETSVGYSTKWGDAAADILPISDLYKTQIRRLAMHVGIPKELALKPSSPSLWPNQMAESELGIKYETLDLILYGLEQFMKPEEIAKQLDIQQAIVNRIQTRILTTEHKRRMPISPNMHFGSQKTIIDSSDSKKN
ncbi:MAG: NAD+ synthase [Crenarchaeota archaeon]|nr:NAD+ synthase [Thermoproteota archaeon]